MALQFPTDNKPQASLLQDGKRLHLSHGPIDLIIEAWGEKEQITQAYQQATARFETILTELADELPLLRTPITAKSPTPFGLVARAMHAAVRPHAHRFITPMAAVAGSVADEILAAMVAGIFLDKAYVNNGGDIALHLGSGTSFRAGVVADPASGRLVTKATINHKSPVRGIATSGHHGRSHSMGIADCVTVFAKTAAIADAAATIIANDVNLPGCPEIIRQPANELSPDSDLGARLVTVTAPPLSASNIAEALNNGKKTARSLWQNGLIEATFLSLQGSERLVGWSIDQPHLIAPHSKFPNQQHRIAHA